jgi:secreted PhoX family phosphatase
MSSPLHPDNGTTINPSTNASINDLIEQRKLSRRGFLRGTFGATAIAAFGGSTIADSLTNLAQAAPSPLGGIGFSAVAPNIAPMIDAITVPAGYTARVLISWGDSLSRAPHWDPSTPMTEAVQLHTYGAHTDGMHYFPFPAGDGGRGHDDDRHRGRDDRGGERIGSRRGLLVANHEYVDPGLVHGTTTYATDPITTDHVDTQLAAHGVSVVEVQQREGAFQVRRPSGFNRRVTGKTPCEVSGPAAGHPLLRTAADPDGKQVLGTLNNCAHGYTPWGTYLACEENFNGYFGTSASALAARPLTDHERRYGLAAGGFGYRWHEADPRFDIRATPNEPNRFGWVVEIDPWNKNSTPVKRTALGRFKHESAGVVVGADNKVAVYMGDDERNEYVYKFVSARKFDARNRNKNRDLLDKGTLYVARFDANGTGTWLPLVWGQNGLTAANGFADQGEVMVKARQAADRVGATMMDRPEWVAVHPTTREVYLTLTNNNRRGTSPVSVNKADGTTTAASARPPVDAANPRDDNRYGHIIRWRETGGDVGATTFAWDIFAECGDSLSTKANHQGNINGDDYGAPDGLWFDQDGRLWIQTDQAGDAKGDWANIGGNVMMCADPASGETRRFLTSPRHCEVTGVTATPDGRTMFVGIQHPGEDWSGSFTANSTWPDSGVNGPTTASAAGAAKPRSSVVVITKDDGGVIGT